MLCFMWSQRVRHDWATKQQRQSHTLTFQEHTNIFWFSQHLTCFSLIRTVPAPAARGKQSTFYCRNSARFRFLFMRPWKVCDFSLSYYIPCPCSVIFQTLQNLPGMAQMHAGTCVGILGNAGWFWLTQASTECSEQNLTQSWPSRREGPVVEKECQCDCMMVQLGGLFHQVDHIIAQMT